MNSYYHMRPDKGLREAKRLPQHHFGNELKIAMAYLDKALLFWIKKLVDQLGMARVSAFTCKGEIKEKCMHFSPW